MNIECMCLVCLNMSFVCVAYDIRLKLIVYDDDDDDGLCVCVLENRKQYRSYIQLKCIWSECVRVTVYSVETEEGCGCVSWCVCLIGLCVFFCVCGEKNWIGARLHTHRNAAGSLRHHPYATRMDWMIWKIAEPQTTNRKRANSQGPTGYWSPFDFCGKKRILILLHQILLKKNRIWRCGQERQVNK